MGMLETGGGCVALIEYHFCEGVNVLWSTKNVFHFEGTMEFLSVLPAV